MIVLRLLIVQPPTSEKELLLKFVSGESGIDNKQPPRRGLDAKRIYIKKSTNLTISE